MTRAPFLNVPTALHIAFTLRTLPVRRQTSLRRALIQAMEALDELTPVQRVWLGRLYGSGGTGAVNFEGMSELEIHGQCTFVVMACSQRLRVAELYAVLCCFASGAEKVVGIEGMAAVLTQIDGTVGEQTFAQLLARRYTRRRDDVDLSYGAIRERTGVSAGKLARLFRFVTDTCHRFELDAVRRLEGTFIAEGVVDERT